MVEGVGLSAPINKAVRPVSSITALELFVKRE